MSKKFVSLLCLGWGLVALTSTAALARNYDISTIDDVEEHLPAGNLAIGSSDLELPYEDSVAAGNEQIVALRYTLPIAKGAKITKAYVEFAFDEPTLGTNPVNLIIEGQLTLNAPIFEDVAKNISSRSPWTKAQAKWAAATWTTAGQKIQTADISAVIQEIIDQPGWAAGNALVLVLRDDKSKPSAGLRCAAKGPVMHLEVFNPTGYAPSPTDGAIGVFMPLLSWTKGDDAILHNVYLGKTADLTPANAVASNFPVTMYYHVQGLDPGAQYYWRVDEVDMAGKVTTGPVWSFVMQGVTAYHPAPANGAVDVSPTGTLTWQPGLAAIKHRVYFGTSLDAVTQGAAGTDKGETVAATFTPTALDSAATYYWRVDELGDGGAVKTGPVWSFTTYLPVDDFESYTDDMKAMTTIFDTWIDGYADGLSNSTVGNDPSPFAEQAIVHGGKQSMPMAYDNTKAPFYSETYQEFVPVENWTVNGLTDLKLAFRGLAANGAGALYVVVQDSSNKSAVVTHPDPAAVTTTTWTEWKIPLSSLTGVNLAKVKRLYIGVGDKASPKAGGAGKIYIDDIRVTKP
jgi:hypothetical protein